MDPRRRSRRSFLATVLTRAASIWVAVTGGLAAVVAACEGDPPRAVGQGGGKSPPPVPDGDAPLYGAPRPRDAPVPQPAPVERPPPVKYGAPPPPPKYGAPPPRPKYGAPPTPAPRPKREAP